MKYLIAFTLFAVILLLSSCTCPPKNPDGTKPPCRYVGPAVSGVLGFQGVTVGITLWGDTNPKAPAVTIPVNKHDPEPLYSK